MRRCFWSSWWKWGRTWWFSITNSKTRKVKPHKIVLLCTFINTSEVTRLSTPLIIHKHLTTCWSLKFSSLANPSFNLIFSKQVRYVFAAVLMEKEVPSYKLRFYLHVNGLNTHLENWVNRYCLSGFQEFCWKSHFAMCELGRSVVVNKLFLNIKIHSVNWKLMRVKLQSGISFSHVTLHLHQISNHTFKIILMPKKFKCRTINEKWGDSVKKTIHVM